MDQTCRTKASSREVGALHSRGTMRRALAIGMAFLLLGVGCGKGDRNRNAISGTVQMDGKPLEKGSIRFSPIAGTKGPVSGGAIENGRYQIPPAVGLVEGRYRVEISATRKTGKMVQAPLAPPGKMVEEYGEALPPRFNSASTLEAAVKPGQNNLDFALKTK
jgi:hypothetical protein